MKKTDLNHSQWLGDRGQTFVSHLLSQHKRKVHMGCKRGANADPWDILVDGLWHLEVKTAQPQKLNRRLLGWKFNLHRHGILDESQVDFYVFRMEKIPHVKWAIHLLIPAPVKRMTIVVTFRSLLNGYGKYALAFRKFSKTGENPFREGDYLHGEMKE